MEIRALELHHVRIPFAVPYKLSKRYGTLTHAEAVVVKLETDDGLAGYGEADPMMPFTEETPASVCVVIRDVFGPLLLGRDPSDAASLERELDARAHGNLMARGALNMALYDLKGKALGVPVHDLLGGAVRRKIPLMGALGSGSPGEDAERIESFFAAGYRTVMLKMGTQPIDVEVKRMEAFYRQFEGRMQVIADANQGWSLQEGLRFVERTRGCPPDLLEQPVDRDDLAGLKRIRESSLSPVSADESLVSEADCRKLLARRVVDTFSIKVSKNGGLGKSLRLAQAARVFGVGCLMNSMLEFGITQAASLQLGCTLANLVEMGHAYMSVLRMADDFTDFADHVKNAVAQVPTRPGLGVEVDDAKLRHYALESLRLESK
ncbi:muconate cycloisomerase [Desulfacinum hydrothermale DSM 13146]|uniref:Muconate cycloisomerase n=1 Tax=Desulfacinum hydrothermale DSM 13146 TaxID=1121390 RepID=A0A1W1XEP5_9BACT|nr:enolase C-terminal domain-like protein [Desulfacinum hydrothermale]SMC22535.1 muconate cycloisomerase [Desulfacinum hydrothermale DSM 13146]